MSNYQIGVFASRLLGLYTIVQSISYFHVVGFSVISLVNGNVNYPIPDLVAEFQIATFIVLLLIGVGLFGFAERIAKYLIRGIDNKEQQVKLEGSSWQAIGFSFIGIYALINAFPRLVNVTAQYFLIDKIMSFDQSMTLQTKVQLLGAITQLIFAFFLLIGSHSFAGLLQKLWNSLSNRMDEE